ncbi:hypothetical protein JCGZ_23290 [Jatropha curcas]|uniref:Pectinesterase inhibitor domain-containing protein n=1 Tax=Jatropha curcas TaxID=180498 RepID=A0A067JHV8_JATCU|nr:putative invertase inhibitor [Jatropha curcas]KDP23457.1 hypothetical protein JCGZ_23290 [Jatropha curcas]
MSSKIIFFILSLASIISTSHQASEIVTQSCEKIPHKDLCLSALGSAPESDVHDLPGLTKFALKMASLNGTELYKKTAELYQTSSDEFVKQCLTDCSEVYQDAIDQLEDSMVAIDSKVYDDVTTWVTAAVTDTQSCEDGFKEKQGFTSPLSQDNAVFSQLCSIALSLSNLLAQQ